jgi:hypothetical protein
MKLRVRLSGLQRLAQGVVCERKQILARVALLSRKRG